MKNEFPCKGCALSGQVCSDGNPYCKILLANMENECPCGKCIIKMMCDDTCEDFNIVRRKLAE